MNSMKGDDEVVRAFAERVKYLRKKKGLTQEELAFNSGVALSQIARIETAKINTTIVTCSRLAKYLGVPLWELFNF